MSRKTPSGGSSRTDSTSKKKTATKKSAQAGAKPAESPAKPAQPSKSAGTSRSPATSTRSETEKSAKTSRKKAPTRGSSRGGTGTAPAKTAAPPAGHSTNDVLARAEADLAATVEALQHQMNAALATLTDLASSRRDAAAEVVRTAPLDRATASFQRLVSEVVDDQFAEMLPPLVSLRNELAQRARDGGPDGDDDFATRGTEALDQVLKLASVNRYEPQPGQRLDPLIHLAVGETHRDDLEDGAIADVLQPGFRSARGRIIAPARVRVNRRS